MTPEQYTTNVCNLLNPNTPEKRAAIVETLKTHPCRKLFVASEMIYDVEEELGLEVDDQEEEGVEEVEEFDDKNPIHNRDQINTILYPE